MTRHSVLEAAVAREPELVTLMRYGILGGLCGKPVAVAFRDFSADIVVGLWQRISRSFDGAEVAEVKSRPDLNNLSKRLDEVNIVLVYPGKHVSHGAMIDWMVEHRRGTGVRLPAVLSVYHPSMSETPGSTLVVEGCPQLSLELNAWLLGETQPDDASQNRNLFDPAAGLSVACGALMKALHGAMPTVTVREARIVEGLVTGAVLSKPQQVSRRAEPHATPAHYSMVRVLLQSRFLKQVEVEWDEITKAMVARANIYLRSTSHNQPPLRPLGARAGNGSTVETKPLHRKDRRVTRCELVELGNPKSHKLKSLVTILLHSRDTSALKQLGINNADFRQQGPISVEDVIRHLPMWSYKMVRTRFDRLEHDGVISASRTEGNGPTIYLFPEELESTHTAFAHLPSDDQLFAHYQKAVSNHPS